MPIYIYIYIYIYKKNKQNKNVHTYFVSVYIEFFKMRAFCYYKLACLAGTKAILLFIIVLDECILNFGAALAAGHIVRLNVDNGQVMCSFAFNPLLFTL
jgi:hypothetical protein